MMQFLRTRRIVRFAERLRQLLHEITLGLEALHRVQFDEPWKHQRRPMSGARVPRAGRVDQQACSVLPFRRAVISTVGCDGPGKPAGRRA